MFFGILSQQRQPCNCQTTFTPTPVF